MKKGITTMRWVTAMSKRPTNLQPNAAQGGARCTAVSFSGAGTLWARRMAMGAGYIVVALASLDAVADQPGEGIYVHHGMWGGGWGGMFFGFFMMLLVIAAIAAAVVLVARVLGASGSGGAKPAGKTPLEILEERFARGEIDTEEFEERRRTLAKG